MNKVIFTPSIVQLFVFRHEKLRHATCSLLQHVGLGTTLKPDISTDHPQTGSQSRSPEQLQRQHRLLSPNYNCPPILPLQILPGKKCLPALRHHTSKRALPSTLVLQGPNPQTMASPNPDLMTESQTTFPSDSENYHADNSSSPDDSRSPPSSSSPLILYSPPTIWGLFRGAAINLLLPFVNGLMLGFGELFAHEAAWRLGWSGTKVTSIHQQEQVESES